MGLFGAFLFVITSIVGGFLIEGYDIFRKFISETYAIDTVYGLSLRLFGFIPSGILLALFCFFSAHYFKASKLTKIGFYGVAIFYGLATIVVSIFPCDSGCNRELVNPSTSQLIHNFTGLLTYSIVPLCIILIGLDLRKFNPNSFSLQTVALGAITYLFVFVLILNVNSDYAGLLQRLVESTILLWIVICAFTIKNKKIVG